MPLPSSLSIITFSRKRAVTRNHAFYPLSLIRIHTYANPFLDMSCEAFKQIPRFITDGAIKYLAIWKEFFASLYLYFFQQIDEIKDAPEEKIYRYIKGGDSGWKGIRCSLGLDMKSKESQIMDETSIRASSGRGAREFLRKGFSRILNLAGRQWWCLAQGVSRLYIKWVLKISELNHWAFLNF